MSAAATAAMSSAEPDERPADLGPLEGGAPTGGNVSSAGVGDFLTRDLLMYPIDGGAGEQNSTSFGELIPEGDLESIVNVTREYPFEYAIIMFGYIMPFVLVLTLITNTLVVMVLYQRHMRTPTNIVLVSMALVDLGTLLSPSPWYLYIYTFGNHGKFLYPPAACYAHHMMTDVVPVFFHTSSIWLALLLASQRYIYVCHPTLARTWCTVPRVKRAIFLILLVAFLHQLTRFVDNTFSPVLVHYKARRHLACKNDVAAWVQRIDIALYYTTYYTFRIFFVFIIPCVALITLNYLLFRALKRAENKRTELLKTKFRLVGVGDRKEFAPRAGKNSNYQVVSYETTRELSSYAAQANNSTANYFEPVAPSAYNRPPRLSNGRSRGPISEKSNSLEGNSVGNFIAPPPASEAPASTTSQRALEQQAAFGRAKSQAARQQPVAVGSRQSSGELEEESICAECAAYERALAVGSCQRCLAALDLGAADEALTSSCDHVGGASSRAHSCHASSQHQPISQCSSILGGATNTTTNTNEEDASSSCLATTQNVSSSMFAVQAGDGTFDGGEPNSLREDEAPEVTGRNSSLESGGANEDPGHARLEGRRQSLSADAGGERSQADGRELARSGSAESRLDCGCLAAARARTLSQRAKRLSRPTLKLRPSASLPSCGNGCSPSPAGSPGEEADECAPGRPASPPSPVRCAASERSLREQSGALSHLDAAEVGRGPSESKELESSANANSIGSLLRVQANWAARNPTSCPAAAAHKQRTKSPSFASSLGRGSRATLAGSSAPPVIGITAPTSATPAQSVRTMDSNRTTLMLVVVVSVFLVVEVPVAIVTILHVVENLFDLFKSDEFMATLNYIKLFTNFFIMISYSVNFTIYCSMSKKFRETFRDLFFCTDRESRRKRAKRIVYQTQAQQSQYLMTNNQQQAASQQIQQHQFTAPPNPASVAQQAKLAANQAGQPQSRGAEFNLGAGSLLARARRNSFAQLNSNGNTLATAPAALADASNTAATQSSPSPSSGSSSRTSSSPASPSSAGRAPSSSRANRRCHFEEFARRLANNGKATTTRGRVSQAVTARHQL